MLSGQNRQKNSLKESVFVNSALKIQCHIVKNHYYRLLFFLPTVLIQLKMMTLNII